MQSNMASGFHAPVFDPFRYALVIGFKCFAETSCLTYHRQMHNKVLHVLQDIPYATTVTHATS